MLGLYIHVPFCRKKCNYCDFVSVPAEGEPVSRYIESACLEMKRYSGTKISTVYVGGGTPSILSNENIARLLKEVYKTFDCSETGEITFEANPESLEFTKLAVLKSLNVNRLSMGVQSFDAAELNNLGRVHSVADFENAYSNARALAFKNIGFDLIYGLQDQPFSLWKENLRKAVSFGPEHISLYPLTIEEGTAFFFKAAKIDEALQARIYEWSTNFLKSKGYEQYEISNWAKKGFRCMHNLNYWHNGEYVGIGVSAASHLNSKRFKNTPDVKVYIEKLRDNEDTREESENIDPEKKLSEEIILALRCSQGIRWTDEKHAKYSHVLEDLMKASLLERVDSNVRLTKKGKLFANQVMMRFV